MNEPRKIERWQIYLSYVIFFVYVFVMMFAIYTPLFTSTPPDDFASGLKKFCDWLSVTVGVALATIAKDSLNKKKNCSMIILIIITAIAVITCGVLAFWPAVTGLPKEGYTDLLTLCASFFVGLFTNFLLKGK